MSQAGIKQKGGGKSQRTTLQPGRGDLQTIGLVRRVDGINERQFWAEEGLLISRVPPKASRSVAAKEVAPGGCPLYSLSTSVLGCETHNAEGARRPCQTREGKHHTAAQDSREAHSSASSNAAIQ